MLTKHMWYESRGIVKIPPTEDQFLGSEAPAETFTWVQCSPNEYVSPDTKLPGGNCIQNPRDPFVLSRYCVSSFMARVSERIQAEGRASDLWARTIWANIAMNV